MCVYRVLDFESSPKRRPFFKTISVTTYTVASSLVFGGGKGGKVEGENEWRMHLMSKPMILIENVQASKTTTRRRKKKKN